MIAWFHDVGCESVALAGGKGAGLARMTRAGLAVPEGFVVGAGCLAAALEAAGQRTELDRLLASGDLDESGAAGIREVVLGLRLPAGEEDGLRAAVGRLGEHVLVAVRSSACAEDSEFASFAGQQDTYLNVRGAEVPDRVRACWASLFSDRALFYRARKGSLADLRMAVVVQRQLTPEKAGVMFTIDPVRRRRDQLIIEAVWGLGEALVSGRVTPDHYVVDREGTVKRARVAAQPLAILTRPGGGTEERALDLELGRRRVLDEDELRQLALLGNRLQAHLGGPQDVEWAFQEGQLYVLQSRPVTT